MSMLLYGTHVLSGARIRYPIVGTECVYSQ
jgi:hypothetical protein